MKRTRDDIPTDRMYSSLPSSPLTRAMTLLQTNGIAILLTHEAVLAVLAACCHSSSWTFTSSVPSFVTAPLKIGWNKHKRVCKAPILTMPVNDEGTTATHPPHDANAVVFLFPHIRWGDKIPPPPLRIAPPRERTPFENYVFLYCEGSTNVLFHGLESCDGDVATVSFTPEGLRLAYDKDTSPPPAIVPFPWKDLTPDTKLVLGLYSFSVGFVATIIE